jgi:phosphonatase-like hydrolase
LRIPALLTTFDIAGTLMEDTGAIVKSFIQALGFSEIKAEEEEIEALRGASKREVIRHLMSKHLNREPSEDEIAKAYSMFKQLLEDSYRKEDIKPITGVEETINWLRSKDILIATTTGFYKSVRDLILEKLRWDGQFFDCNVCSDDVPKGRPAPFMIFQCMGILKFYDVKRVLAIGDTPLDLQAGCNAGCGGVIGVLTGAHGIESLGMTRHSHIIPGVASLPDLIEKEFSF